MRKQDSLRFFMLLRHMTSLSLSIGYISGKELYFLLKGSRCGRSERNTAAFFWGRFRRGKWKEFRVIG